MSDQSPTFELAADAGKGLRIGVVTSRFNHEVTTALREGALLVLRTHGVAATDIVARDVPGAYELPIAALHLARTARLDAVVCLGALIRGDTSHYDVLAAATASAIQDVALSTGLPVVFGVLTCENLEQARDRIGGSHGHKGQEAAATAIEMARLFHEPAEE